MTSTIDSITALAADTCEFDQAIKLAAQHTSRFHEAAAIYKPFTA
jgi:hypothetical protein